MTAPEIDAVPLARDAARFVLHADATVDVVTGRIMRDSALPQEHRGDVAWCRGQAVRALITVLNERVPAPRLADPVECVGCGEDVNRDAVIEWDTAGAWGPCCVLDLAAPPGGEPT